MDNKPGYLQNLGDLATKRFKEFELFRQNLIILQATKNATNQEMSVLLGLRPKRVEDYKLGRCHPKFDELRMIANFFNVTLDQLLYKKAIVTFEE
jgi:hypothetical protein